MTFRSFLLATSLVALPAAAAAQPVTGLYIGAGAGANGLAASRSDVDLPILRALAGTATSGRTRVSWEAGWTGLASIGWGFGNGLRAELEGSYRDNGLDRIAIYGQRATAVSGQARSYGALGNILYDFTLPGLSVSPYLGLGIGYVRHEYDGVRGRIGALQGVVDDAAGRFAYQAIAGLSLPVPAIPGLALTAEYRFLGTLLPELNATVRSTATGATVDRGRIQVGDFNHSVLIGLRYAFNAPHPAVSVAAPVAPAAALAPARTYLVFFDFDRADLTDRARQIIAEAAQAVTSTGTTRIEVAGHADRAGTPQYNQRLSMRRAEAVAAELSRRGVARNAMSIQAFGESRPLVPTADGVREPQNRRVEIVLR